MSRGFNHNLDPFFPGPVSCPSGILGLFPLDWRVMGLSGIFRPRGFPRDQRGRLCSRNRGLGFGIGRILGDFRQFSVFYSNR